MLAAGLFSIQSVSVKLLGERIHVFEIGFFRCLFGLVVLLPYLYQRGFRAFTTRRPRLHIWRCAVGMTGMMASFYAVTQLPIATATAYAFTMPLFMIVLAVLLLGETVRWRRWSATLVGFLGVLVMMRPGAEAFHDAALFALAGALCSATVYVTIKKLAVTEAASTQTLYFAVVGGLVSLPFALSVWVAPTAEEYLYLAAAGILGTAGQIMAVYGWHAGEATAVAPFDYTRLLLAGFLGYLVFAEVPDALTLLGAGIIVASTLYIARREARIRAERKAAA